MPFDDQKNIATQSLKLGEEYVGSPNILYSFFSSRDRLNVLSGTLTLYLRSR